MLATWVDKYPIISIEDGMAEGDWDGWKVLTDRLGKNVQIVGDDLFVTNHQNLQGRYWQGYCQFHPDQDQPDRHPDRNLCRHRNGQKGRLHRRHQSPLGWNRRLHHCRHCRGHQCRQIKTGSLSRSDRMAKYNQLLRIEEDLGDVATYPGRAAFYNLR